MLKIEEYKLFHNSQDFDGLILKSKDFINNNEVDYENFITNIYAKAKKSNSALILYKNNIPIGYELAVIANRTVCHSFTYIIPTERNKKYSYILREKMIEILIDKVDKYITVIKKNNISSIKGLNKILNKYPCEFSIEKVISKSGEIYEKYTITKRPD